MKTISFTESRANYAATLDAVVNDREEIVVTRAGCGARATRLGCSLPSRTSNRVMALFTTSWNEARLARVRMGGLRSLAER